MKDKILVFIIGLLVGAVITVSAFLIYEKVNDNTNQMEFKDGMQMQMMERPEGMNFDNSNGNRPEPPSKNNSTFNSSNL